MIIKSKKNNGFTLMETMIYIALFSIILTGAITGAYNLLEGGKRNIDSSKIEEDGNFINRKINWALSGATTVSVSPSGKILTITRPDLGAQSPIIISENSGEITIQRSSGVPVPINNDRFVISDTVFTYKPADNGKPPSIFISFKVNGTNFQFKNYLRV